MPYGECGGQIFPPAPSTAVQQLHLSDPAYTERLAAFLESLGQTVITVAPGHLELEPPLSETELAIYLKVWHVLYPEALVSLARGG
jgi:hypothetical protein